VRRGKKVFDLSGDAPEKPPAPRDRPATITTYSPKGALNLKERNIENITPVLMRHRTDTNSFRGKGLPFLKSL